MSRHGADGHVARKRFGQHFLVDQSVVRGIVDAIAPQPTDTLIEIGPGLGALTRPLLERLPRMHAIEIDRDIVARLRGEFPEQRLAVHQADVLEFDFAQIGTDLRVVGNLPYNISTPILFHLATHAGRLRDGHFMLQKEVVERMAADPGGGEYGRLTVMLRYRFAIDNLFEVGPEAFDPPPKVRSAIVRIRPLNPLPFPADDEALLAQLVTRAFTQRRKTLRNAVGPFLSPVELEAIGIDPGDRPETLGVEQWVRAANAVSRRGVA